MTATDVDHDQGPASASSSSSSSSSFARAVDRVHVGGLDPSKGLTVKHVRARLESLPGVEVLSVDDGDPDVRTFLFADVALADDDDRRRRDAESAREIVRAAYHNVRWKGCRLTVATARPHVLKRLAAEREERRRRASKRPRVETDHDDDDDDETRMVTTVAETTDDTVRKTPRQLRIRRRHGEEAVRVDTKPMLMENVERFESYFRKVRRLERKMEWQRRHNNSNNNQNRKKGDEEMPVVKPNKKRSVHLRFPEHFGDEKIKSGNNSERHGSIVGDSARGNRSSNNERNDGSDNSSSSDSDRSDGGKGSEKEDTANDRARTKKTSRYVWSDSEESDEEVENHPVETSKKRLDNESAAADANRSESDDGDSNVEEPQFDSFVWSDEDDADTDDESTDADGEGQTPSDEPPKDEANTDRADNAGRTTTTTTTTDSDESSSESRAAAANDDDDDDVDLSKDVATNLSVLSSLFPDVDTRPKKTTATDSSRDRRAATTTTTKKSVVVARFDPTNATSVLKYEIKKDAEVDATRKDDGDANRASPSTEESDVDEEEEKDNEKGSDGKKETSTRKERDGPSRAKESNQEIDDRESVADEREEESAAAASDGDDREEKSAVLPGSTPRSDDDVVVDLSKDVATNLSVLADLFPDVNVRPKDVQTAAAKSAGSVAKKKDPIVKRFDPTDATSVQKYEIQTDRAVDTTVPSNKDEDDVVESMRRPPDDGDESSSVVSTDSSDDDDRGAGDDDSSSVVSTEESDNDDDDDDDDDDNESSSIVSTEESDADDAGDDSKENSNKNETRVTTLEKGVDEKTNSAERSDDDQTRHESPSKKKKKKGENVDRETKESRGRNDDKNRSTTSAPNTATATTTTNNDNNNNNGDNGYVYEQSKLEDIFKQARGEAVAPKAAAGAFRFSLVPEEKNDGDEKARACSTERVRGNDAGGAFSFSFALGDDDDADGGDRAVRDDANVPEPRTTVHRAAPERAYEFDVVRHRGLFSFANDDRVLLPLVEAFYDLRPVPGNGTDEENEKDQEEWFEERKQLTLDWKRKKRSAAAKRKSKRAKADW